MRSGPPLQVERLSIVKPSWISNRKATPPFPTSASSGWTPPDRAALTGVLDCAGFAPNLEPKAVCHELRFHSSPATLLRLPFCPSHRSRLVFSRCRSGEGKNNEIRRSQEANKRGRRFPRRSALALHFERRTIHENQHQHQSRINIGIDSSLHIRISDGGMQSPGMLPWWRQGA